MCALKLKTIKCLYCYLIFGIFSNRQAAFLMLSSKLVHIFIYGMVYGICIYMFKNVQVCISYMNTYTNIHTRIH